MSTLIHFRCRNPWHVGAPGEGTIVMRHGTAAYCDAPRANDRHQWVATGGVPLESLMRQATQITLWEDGDDHVHAGARNVSDQLGHAGAPALVP